MQMDSQLRRFDGYTGTFNHALQLASDDQVKDQACACC
ncbi:hypothetical protein KPSA3_01933 [Pseudomonas syringae pv. actinidiae]|uniref:Uncharacterized protein n=1 Tax=Pseudomonas syringae pv. actinidiae TaxID=103796 RepID=A0AAN4Q210_PSESF|nr:hypothetical protein KPSA3_01933 [Pseudomonas syringae pv. actinidiae]